MKSVSPALAALLQNGEAFQGEDVFAESNIFAIPNVFATGNRQLPGFAPYDLYLVTTTSGLVLAYTTAPFPILISSSSLFDAPAYFTSGTVWTPGLTFQPFVIDMSGTRSTGHWKAGLDSDNWEVKIAPRPFNMLNLSATETGDVFAESNIFAVPNVFGVDSLGGPDLIGGVPWLQAAATGALDDADCIVARAYFSAPPSWDATSPNWIGPNGAVPVGTLILFRGFLGEITIDDVSASLTVSDYKQTLQQQMPRNIYQSSCRNIFCDTRCGIALSGVTQSATVAAGSTAGLIVSAAVAAPSGSATYALGILTMTSGLNKGCAQMVSAWDGAGNFNLLAPMPYPPAIGDTFTVSAGCSKTIATCTAFSNLTNFNAEPYAPTPEVVLT